MLQVGELAKAFEGYQQGSSNAATGQRQLQGKWRQASIISPDAFMRIAS